MIDGQKREAFASLSSLFSCSRKEEKPKLVRPPYNEERTLFATHCPTCVDTPCVSACEEAIIGIDAQHMPYVFFTESGCTFCEECARVCPHEVLHVELTCKAKIAVDFRINMKECMAWNSIICNSCADVCDVFAITFFGMLRPTLSMDKCTGCGFCYGVCPTNAITFKSKDK